MLLKNIPHINTFLNGKLKNDFKIKLLLTQDDNFCGFSENLVKLPAKVCKMT